MPVDVYVGGMEHAIMHLLYARFWHKFVCDHFGISDDSATRRHADHSVREPFKELIVQGLVKSKTYKLKSGRFLTRSEVESGKYKADDMIESYEKMSKSKGNGVAPSEMAEKYGVDTLRMAIMFGAPPEKDLNFDEKQL